MLEVLIPGIRYGEGFTNTSTGYRGMFMFVSGYSATYGGPILDLPASTAEAKMCCPINKIYFGEDYSDTADAVDKIAKGQRIIYYEGGTYITNKYVLGINGISTAAATALAGRDLTSAIYGRPFTVDYATYKGKLRQCKSTPSLMIGWLEGFVGSSANAKVQFRLQPLGARDLGALGTSKSV